MTVTQFRGTGRRKRSIARIILVEGTGKFVVNGREFDDYVNSLVQRTKIVDPFRLTGNEGRFDVKATVIGGGTTGQAGALRLGVARAMLQVDPEYRGVLKKAGLLSRDDRVKERKKYGLRKARKAPQYSKR